MRPGGVDHPLGPIHRRHSGNGCRERQDQQGRMSGPVEKQGSTVHKQTVTRRWIAYDSLYTSTSRQNSPSDGLGLFINKSK